MVHDPVLLKEVVEYLDPQKDDVILDATINGGGHSKAILEKIEKKGTLVGIDQDESLIEDLISNFQFPISKKNVILLNGNFRDLDELLNSAGIKKINGALFDLGMSSRQLAESGRGFSFQKDEPLAMTFKSELGPNDLTAKEILNRWNKDDIYEILKNYGEERFAKRISEEIVTRRKRKKFETTFDLVEAIRDSVPVFYAKGRIHFATKTFQALRIEVNDELEAIEEGLAKSWNMLEKGGRIVVISFHSLEDRIVKNFMRGKKESEEGQVFTKKPVVAGNEERNLNPRSRSAKLRAIKKL